MNRKTLFAVTISLAALTLISWGTIGHRTIARIAEDHLTPAAKTAIEGLLGSQSLADVSTWADEVRPTPEYRETGPWHYINLPLGLDYKTFDQQVRGMTEANVYSAVLKCESDLKSSTTTKDQKIVALKFLVHFVGDLHQPMHVSRAEDKGGNTVQVNYEGQGTNLHALWDSKLIEHLGMNDAQLSAQYDHIPQDQVRQWQSAPLMQWLWESYQISSRLYSEVDQMSNRTITDAYFKQHIPIIEQRIQQAGIRLAGVLNDIFKTPITNAPGAAPAAAAPSGSNAASTPGQVTICDKVFSGKYFENSGLTLLNLGAEYPNQKMTIVIRGADRAKFPQAPDTYFIGKQVCVTGQQQMFKGKPEIVVSDPEQIQVKSAQ